MGSKWVSIVAGFVSDKMVKANCSIVRPGGKILCIGGLNTENTVHMKVGVRKRLSFIFSYGGQYQDIVELLHLIDKDVFRPYVETAGLEDFPKVLKDLVDGKVKGRMALIPEP